jgi:hypothetical protein
MPYCHTAARPSEHGCNLELPEIKAIYHCISCSKNRKNFHIELKTFIYCTAWVAFLFRRKCADFHM